MKLKILSEGYGHNTKVVNMDTDEELEGVVSIEWSIGPGEMGRCELIMQEVPIVVIGDKIKRYKLSNKK